MFDVQSGLYISKNRDARETELVRDFDTGTKP